MADSLEHDVALEVSFIDARETFHGINVFVCVHIDSAVEAL